MKAKSEAKKKVDEIIHVKSPKIIEKTYNQSIMEYVDPKYCGN